jgi:hypothetical protein
MGQPKELLRCFSMYVVRATQQAGVRGFFVHCMDSDLKDRYER